MNTLTKVEKYMQLVLAKDSEIWEDMCANGYVELGDCYTLGDDDNEKCIELDYVAKTKIVTLVGREPRCHVDVGVVYVAKDGTVWVNSDDFDEYFC